MFDGAQQIDNPFMKSRDTAGPVFTHHQETTVTWTSYGVITLSSYTDITQHARSDTQKRLHGRAPTHLAVVSVWEQSWREEDSREGLSRADVRGTTPAKCLFSLLWEKTAGEWIHPAAPHRVTNGRYTLSHCGLGPICNGMCCLILGPFTVVFGTAWRYCTSKSNNLSTLENKHTVY